MFIRYKGGRSHYEISLNRKPYYFTKENNRIADIREQEVINYIFSLPNRAEFEVVMEEKTSIPEPKIKPKKEEMIVKPIKKKEKKNAQRKKSK